MNHLANIILATLNATDQAFTSSELMSKARVKSELPFTTDEFKSVLANLKKRDALTMKKAPGRGKFIYTRKVKGSDSINEHVSFAGVTAEQDLKMAFKNVDEFDKIFLETLENKNQNPTGNYHDSHLSVYTGNRWN